MIRVVIAEEHQISRWALAEALGKIADFIIVGQAGTVVETLALIRKVKHDVLVLDTTMPDHSGFDVLAEIGKIETGPLVVVLAPFTDASYAARAIRAGAHAYVAKSAAPQELVDAIRAVMRGEQVMPHGVERILEAEGRPGTLTARELQVMDELARGLTNREIAENLGISIKTIDTHRGHVLKKLGLRNNAELVRFAIKHGYVTL